MTQGISRLIAPAEEPLTLAETKQHLRVDHNEDDALISTLIASACQAAESRTGRVLIAQKWRATLETWPG